MLVQAAYQALDTHAALAICPFRLEVRWQSYVHLFTFHREVKANIKSHPAKRARTFCMPTMQYKVRTVFGNFIPTCPIFSTKKIGQ